MKSKQDAFDNKSNGNFKPDCFHFTNDSLDGLIRSK